jgi:hypothetical protein
MLISAVPEKAVRILIKKNKLEDFIKNIEQNLYQNIYFLKKTYKNGRV